MEWSRWYLKIYDANEGGGGGDVGDTNPKYLGLGGGNLGDSYGFGDLSSGGDGSIYQTDQGTVYTGSAASDAFSSLLAGNTEPPRKNFWERATSWLRKFFKGGKKISNRLTAGTPERLPDGHTRLFGLIENANVNAYGQSPLEAYRESQSNSLYNPEETSLDRSFRLISSSHIEIMQDFGGGGYNMFGGYGRIGNVAGATENLVKIGTSEDDIMIFTAQVGDEIIEGITNFTVKNDRLYLNQMHLQGSSAGKVGRSSLWNLAKDLGKQYNVQEVIIQGGKRTTGKYIGKVPSPITIKVD